ncbi:PaaI family thioesterase [Desulforhopalus sp. IMCC35007]|uniref:PaaI family thioesterase n=1 Tax=Desulforhopalus sp. IMCC35007 TaxID=2569543 RepID=UPI0010AE3DF3|nr:PaaI family thioesterase [Desulforhopalus sp. IMCC35007]TKB09595.1 PaaI family thioesterase [Desulforhopalus sp. IMCC35007]
MTKNIEAIWKQLPNLDKDCFGCGLENHSGLHMTFETNGEQIRSKITVPPQFRGWSKLVHGGVISTILDETMSWAVIFLSKKLVLTKQMTIQFRRPVYVGSTLSAIGYIKEKTGERKAIVKGELFDDEGKLCASSEGEFVLYAKEQFARLGIIPEKDLQAMVASFEDV